MQFQLRERTGQLLSPVLQLTVEAPRRRLLVLPRREIRVADGHLGQLRCDAVAARLVTHRQFPPQDIQGPVVVDHMVETQNEQVIRATETDQQRSHQRCDPQVKGSTRLFHRELKRTRFTLGVRRASQVGERQVQHAAGRGARTGNAVDREQLRSENFVTRNQLRQRAPQRVNIECPTQSIGVGHVVGRISREQFLEKPQSLLRERQSYRRARGARRDWIKALLDLHPTGTCQQLQ